MFRIDSEGNTFTYLKIILNHKNGENMKSIIVSMVAAAGLMVAGSALAAEMPDLAKKNNCTACHALDKKVVGPSFGDISKKCNASANAQGRGVVTSSGASLSDTLQGFRINSELNKFAQEYSASCNKILKKGRHFFKIHIRSFKLKTDISLVLL